MGFKKQFGCGVGGWDELYPSFLGFLDFFNFAKPLNAPSPFDADALPMSMLKCGVRPGPVTIDGIMTLQCHAIQVRPVFP